MRLAPLGPASGDALLRSDILSKSSAPRTPMPLSLPAGRPALVILKDAFERSGITRAAIDERLGLTADEFRVEGTLVCIGPIPNDDGIQDLIADLEEAGLTYFEDFFELTGNWPDWLTVFVMGRGDVA